MNTFVDPEPRINEAVNDLCKTTLVKYTCQLFEDGGSDAQPYASGVFVLLGGSYYIFTAAHVLEKFTDDHRPLVRYKNGFIEIAGIVHETDLQKDNAVDLCYIKLDPLLVEKLLLHYQFLTIDRIRQHKLVEGSSNYCVIGFPTVNQYHDGKRLRTGASTLLLQPSKKNVYDNYNLDEGTCFILEMKGKGIDLVTNKKRKVTDEVHGYSGCGLWQLIMNINEEEIFIDYKLIGIMTEFRKGKYYCLIGNKIELLLQGLVVHQGLKIQPRKNHA